MKARALTVCNPYPELIALGEKPLENRTKVFNYRGELFIHAGLSHRWMTNAHQQRFPNLTYGAITCVVAVVECLPKAYWMRPGLSQLIHEGNLRRIEEARARWSAAGFGHLYSHEHAIGPHCMVLANVRRLKTPVQCKGKQGIWFLPADVEALVREQLKAIA